MNRLVITLILILFVIWGCPCHLFAQSTTISGVVTSASGYVSGAAIFNKNVHIKVISDLHGGFNIRAHSGDTLLVSRKDFKPDTVVAGSDGALIVQLKANGFRLKEVQIKDSPLTPEAKFRQNQQAYHDIYRIGDDKNMVIITPIGIGLDIDKLYSALSRQGKNARKLQRELKSQYHEDIVDRKFSRSLVARVTGYKNAQLDDFMARYRPSFEFVSKKNEYGVIEYIKACMKQNNSVSSAQSNSAGRY